MQGMPLVKLPEIPVVPGDDVLVGTADAGAIKFSITYSTERKHILHVSYVCLDASATVEYFVDEHESFDHAIDLIGNAMKQAVVLLHTEDLIRCKLDGLRVN